MFTRNRPAVIATVGISIVIAFSFAVTTARMQATPPDVTLAQFGLVGVSRGQVARLNAVNAVQGVGPTPFRVKLGFVDADGHPLRDRAGNEVRLEVELSPGKRAWLDLDAADVLPANEARKQIRPLVSLPAPNDGVPATAAPLIATLELFDRASGRTEVLYVPVLNDGAPAR